MKSITKYLKKLDSFGAEVKLTYNRKQNQKSLFGALLTLLAYIIVTFSAFRITSNYLDKTNVDISVSAQVSKNYHEVNLSAHYYYPILLPFDANHDPIGFEEIKDFFVIEGYTYQVILNISGTEDWSTFDITNEFGFVPCKQFRRDYYEVFFDPKNDFVETMIREIGLCPFTDNLDYFSIKGGFSEPESTFVDLAVYPCHKKSSDNCGDLELLNGASLVLVLPKFSFDPQNVTNPIKITSNLEEILTIKPGMSFIRDYKILKTEIWDDINENIFAKPTLKREFYTLDLDNTKNIFTDHLGDPKDYITCTGLPEDECTPYYDILIKSGHKTTVIKRKYKKGADVLGEIGGIQQTVLLVCGMVWLLQKSCARRKMARDAFDYFLPQIKESSGRGDFTNSKGAKNLQINSLNIIHPKLGRSGISNQNESKEYKNDKERVKLMEEALEEGLVPFC